MWTHRISGKTNQRGSLDNRDPYERDKTRVIHSPSFRSLQRKRQILDIHSGDFHRTRLTHSLEVASIGSSIVRNFAKNSVANAALLPSDDLIEAICLLHDIGHPPFGHGGEVALNYKMADCGGFEANAQTLRLVTKIERSYGDFGLDLTRRVLLGILKYPVIWDKVQSLKTPEAKDNLVKINDWLPPKAYFNCEEKVVNWILQVFDTNDKDIFSSLIKEPQNYTHGKTQYCSFDCSIMNIADDIAYGVHDVEDAIHLKLLTRENFDTAQLKHLFDNASLEITYDNFLQNVFSQDLPKRKQALGYMVNYFINSTDIIVSNESFNNPLLKHKAILSSQAELLLQYFIDCIYTYIIDSQEVRTFEYGGQNALLRLFDAINTNPMSLLDMENRKLYANASDKNSASRIVCDYIALMTDEYAMRTHERLFGFSI